MYRIIHGSKVRCMPPKGTLTERIELKPIMNQVKKHLGAKVASMLNVSISYDTVFLTLFCMAFF